MHTQTQNGLARFRNRQSKTAAELNLMKRRIDMNIKKLFYGQKAVKTPTEKDRMADEKKLSCSSLPGSEAKAEIILRYYRTSSLENGIMRFGICIDAVTKNGTDSYLAPDICVSAKEAEELICLLYRHAVSPSGAEECLDEILSSEILSPEILSSEILSSEILPPEILSDTKRCA